MNVEQEEIGLKSMPGETADDVRLTQSEEMSRVMCCVHDQVSSEMDERLFKQLVNFNEKFSFLLDTKSLLTIAGTITIN